MGFWSVDMLVVCAVFIETVSPHWLRSLVLLGPILDVGIYWLAANAGGILWLAVIAFLVDAVCIVVTFAKNSAAGKRDARALGAFGVLLLTAAVNAAICNVACGKVNSYAEAVKLFLSSTFRWSFFKDRRLPKKVSSEVLSVLFFSLTASNSSVQTRSAT